VINPESGVRTRVQVEKECSAVIIDQIMLVLFMGNAQHLSVEFAEVIET
jgi:hypothetical protein